MSHFCCSVLQRVSCRCIFYLVETCMSPLFPVPLVCYENMVTSFAFFLFSFNQVKKVHPREMNPYLKDDGSGYPEDTDGSKASGDKLLSSSVVGDGGASWRLKALKRAQEQAAREGRRLNEVLYLNFQIF